MEKSILLNELTIGSIIEEDIKTDDDKILVRKGTVLTENLLERLRQWNIKFNTASSTEDKTKEVKDSKEVQKKIEKSLKLIYTASLGDLDRLLSDLESNLSNIYDDLKTIEDLPDNITKIRFAGDCSGHYYRTARLAATLTSMYNKGVSKEQQISLPSITLAALLHDYGMRFSNDPDSLGKLKVGKFDYESQAMLNAPYKDKHSSVYSRLKIVDVISGPYNEKYHTAYAYVALKDKVPTEVREMILYSQYTKDAFSSRKHKKVIKAANIISLCEVYDNLLEYVIKSDMAAPIENVITYLGQLAHNGVLDMDVFTLFLNNISLYPVGTKVLLSDNQYAVVVRNNSGFPSKPLVLTLTPASSVLIDLSETTNITIRRIVKTDEEVDKVDVIHSEQLNGVFDEDIIPSGENPGTLILKKGETDGEKILGKKF